MNGRLERRLGKNGNKNVHSLYLGLNITIDGAEKKIEGFPGKD